MIVIGIIFILTGGSCWMYGDSLNNDYETQIRSVWNEGKTNPGSIFVIIGIIVVIIGAILILCGIFYKITAPNKKSNQITPIICPFCKQSNSSLNSFCTKCGRLFDETIDDETNNIVNCSNCGTANEIDSSFCKNCGNKLK